MRRRERCAALLVGAVILVSGGRAAAAAPLPSDDAARGSIGLCNRAGRPVTSGSVTDKPFVWRAVGSQAAQSPFDGKGTSGTLYAFQPRPGIPASQWSGDTLTAASAYTNKQHPMAQATQLDFTLQDYLNEYPTKQDGLVQLRLIVGASGAGAAPVYASTFLRVSGRSWSVVSNPAAFSCTDGSAVSTEFDAGIVDKRGNAIGTAAASLSASAASVARSSVATRSGSASSARTGTSVSAGPSRSGTALSPGPSTAASGAAASDSSGSSGGGTLLWVVLITVLALGGAVVWWRRHRAPVSPAD